MLGPTSLEGVKFRGAVHQGSRVPGRQLVYCVVDEVLYEDRPAQKHPAASRHITEAGVFVRGSMWGRRAHN